MVILTHDYAKINSNMSKKLTTDEFKTKAHLIHGDRYNYDDTVYTSMHKPVSIKCAQHGAYQQTPGNHLSKKGCARCANIIRKTNDIFIKEAQLIHGDMFNYALVEYTNARKKVKLICRTHGIFEQTPDKHLQGHGCAKCNTVGNSYARHSPDEIATLYVVQISNKTECFYKIGITIRKILKTRFSNIRSLGYNIDYLYVIKTNLRGALAIENKILSLYKHLQYKPLKKFSGWTECLTVPPSFS